jgi:hypothetical protein
MGSVGGGVRALPCVALPLIRVSENERVTQVPKARPGPPTHFVQINFHSEQFGDGRTRRDPCPRQRAGKRLGDLSRPIVGIERKGAGKVITIRGQCDGFGDVRRTNRTPDSIVRVIGELVGEPGKVIQVVFRSARLFPDAQAEVPILRWPHGIHDFRFVGMPHCQGIVDDCVGNGFPVAGVGGENYVPHAHDRWAFFFIAAHRSHDVHSTHLWIPRCRFRELRRHSALRQGARHHRPCKYQRS